MLIVVALFANFVALSTNGQTVIGLGPRLNPCEQLAHCLAKYDSIASMDCVIIQPNTESASLENAGGDLGKPTSADKSSSENSKLPEAVGTCLEDMRSGLDSLRQKMAERLQFYSKCLIDQAANQTTETLLADMDPRQLEKCKAASADVLLEDTCRFVDKQKPEKEKTDKDSKKKKKRESSDEPKKAKENLATTTAAAPVTTLCGAQKRYLVKQCQKVAKCCPILETCRLNFELSDTHKDLTRTKLSVITQRQKCILMAKKVDLESSKLDLILGEDIFNENGLFI